jgi:hypothetical protein
MHWLCASCWTYRCPRVCINYQVNLLGHLTPKGYGLLSLLVLLVLEIKSAEIRRSFSPLMTCAKYGGQPFVLLLDSSTFRSPGGGKENELWSNPRKKLIEMKKRRFSFLRPVNPRVPKSADETPRPAAEAKGVSVSHTCCARSRVGPLCPPRPTATNFLVIHREHAITLEILVTMLCQLEALLMPRSTHPATVRSWGQATTRTECTQQQQQQQQQQTHPSHSSEFAERNPAPPDWSGSRQHHTPEMLGWAST